MANPGGLSPWPGYPDIPPKAQRTTVTTIDTSRTISPVSPLQAPHYITVTPRSRSTNCSLRTPDAYSTQPFTRQYTQQQPQPPTDRYLFPVESSHDSKLSKSWTSRASKARLPDTSIEQVHQSAFQVRFGDFPSSQQTAQAHPKSGSAFGSGLGIVDGLSNLASITAGSPTAEKNGSLPNIAQRIEKRLWRYSVSDNVIKRWLLEIISWIISASCMGAVIGVMIFHRDKPLPRWPLGLTLNAYIAILSKVSGAALLLPTSEALGQLKWSWFQRHSKKMWDFEIFDNASRGPWGSLLLLIRTKGKALAALGAAITLFSLALDPFFQQVVNFPERWTCNGTSSIPRVVRYEPRYPVIFRSGGSIGQFDPDIKAVGEKFFFENGTQPVPFGNGTRADIPLSCPTSNCTWESYESLGVCSTCSDVSEYLSFRCLKTRVDWISNLTGMLTPSNWPNGTMCGYFLNATSALPILMSGYLVKPVESTAGQAPAGEALLTRAMPLFTNPARRPLFGGSINFKHIRNPIADVLIVSAANGLDSVKRNEAPIARECVLYWCVKTIRSSYFWANYEEEVMSTFINETVGPYPFESYRVEEPGFNGTAVRYLEDVNIKASSTTYDNSLYELSNVTHLRAIAAFDDILPSYTTVINSSSGPLMRYSNGQNEPLQRTVDLNPWLPPNDVTLHMERLATALTNTIRSSASKEMIHGMAFSKETFVSVRWEWITLPLGLLLLSLIFLGATIIKTAIEQDRVGVWKTSAIATLLYGLPDDMQRKIASSTLTGTPRAKAKELKVKLLPTKGWRVSGTLLSPLAPKVRQNQPPPGWI